MDGIVLGVFLLSAFIGGVTTGLAGFAMGLVVSGVWLHILAPVQTATLIVGYAVLVQSYGIWTLRHALDWRRIAPFVVGGAIGIPIGAGLLTRIDPAYLRTGVGILLVIYSAYGLARPAIRPIRSGVLPDVGVGFLNGLLGALTGLAGVIVTVWCQWRDWPKDEQRAVFQPVILAAMAMTGLSFAVAGAITVDTIKLYLVGLPVVLAGTWTGLKLYGHLDEAAFRRIVLVLLLLSGAILVIPLSLFSLTKP
jgi:uncharacterized membrane protein YfcA